MTLEKGWYLINDEEQFLFAANEVWKAYWKQHDAALIHKAREDVLQEIHKKTLAMMHRASSDEVNNESFVLDYSAVYELLQSLRAQQAGDP